MNDAVLIVDDEAAIADLVEVYLKNEGYQVYKFYNGKDALSCIENNRVSLAILDVFPCAVKYGKTTFFLLSCLPPGWRIWTK